MDNEVKRRSLVTNDVCLICKIFENLVTSHNPLLNNADEQLGLEAAVALWNIFCPYYLYFYVGTFLGPYIFGTGHV